MRKDLQTILDKLQANGWRVEITKKGVVKMFSPDGATLVTCHQTESDHRALKNTVARLRRAGAVI